MGLDDRQHSPERKQTDESLRVERETTDEALDEQADLEARADAVINLARARADEVLPTARAKTDRQTRASNDHATERLERKRVLEDEAVREERAEADETVRAERAEHISLLTLEREGTDRDLHSERARSDDALATRDAFLGIVSHDLRNMLNGLVGFAGLIAMEVAAENHEAQVLAYAERIQRSAARMNRLIGDLVDVASIEAGQLAVTRVVQDPTHIVKEAVEAFQAQASSGRISLRAEIGTSPMLAAIDPARIFQVLINLLSNAIKFTAPNGQVVVRLERSGDELRFAVSDTGVGIPPNKLEAVFERFLQVESDRRGVGLGLYISKCIVQGHGGRVWVESKLGEGSTFCFTLPLDVEA